MSVLYLHTAPRPAIDGTDAVYNEIEEWRKKTGGHILTLYPLRTPSSAIPRFLYGWHQIFSIIKLQKDVSEVHIISPTLHWYPILSLVHKDLVYHLTTSINVPKSARLLDRLRMCKAVIVSSKQDEGTLRSLGLSQARFVRPMYDVSKFKPHHLPLQDELVLLMASAPWEKSQFESKGVIAILDMLAQTKNVKVIFLWRGILYNQMRKLVQEYGVEDQVEIINEKVDVVELHKRVHAVILLAKDRHVVKSYPHSLIEAVASGKPVICSKVIPMAEEIAESGVGIVVNDYGDLARALMQLRANLEKGIT